MNNRINFDIRETSIGNALIAINTRGVCGIYLAKESAGLIPELRTDFPTADLEPAVSDQQETVERVRACIQDPREHFDLPLDIRAGDFEQMIWAAIRSCPPGKTLTPATIARLIGASPEAATNVVQVCRSNKLAIAVPCHRVVTSDGALSICRWGEKIQKSLLAREQVFSAS
jgi:AraC family transcriptional regulator, regulatory protein of adaptative response / methylated-DNA-[protein]-cysteine methyltransferase